MSDVLTCRTPRPCLGTACRCGPCARTAQPRRPAVLILQATTEYGTLRTVAMRHAGDHVRALTGPHTDPVFDRQQATSAWNDYRPKTVRAQQDALIHLLRNRGTEVILLEDAPGCTAQHYPRDLGFVIDHILALIRATPVLRCLASSTPVPSLCAVATPRPVPPCVRLPRSSATPGPRTSQPGSTSSARPASRTRLPAPCGTWGTCAPRRRSSNTASVPARSRSPAPTW